MINRILGIFGISPLQITPDPSFNANEPDQKINSEEMETTEALIRRVRRLEDIIEIQQLQSQYAYWLFTKQYERIVEHCFAHKAEGIKIEFSDSGVYSGIEGVRRLFKAFESTRTIPGFFTLHMTVNPCIVVAEDGLSAKSTWLSPGAAASPAGARWVWGPYYVDYVLEEENWKIRRTVFAPLFRNRYENSWVEETDHGSVRGALEVEPDAPPTLYRPYDRNSADLFRGFPEDADSF